MSEQQQAVEIDVVLAWVDRRRAAIPRAAATESTEFWRGYQACLDDIADLAVRRRQRVSPAATQAGVR